LGGSSGSGNGGGSGTGGSGTGGSGSGVGGNPAVVVLDAGSISDATPTGCPEGDARCAATGREVCNGGVWQPDACELGAPRCEGEGECVVRGPALVAVGSFFVDATEVTVGQYGEFLAAKNGDMSGQAAVCSWNSSYWEGSAVMEPAQQPITNVDWCDAAAFCGWAGKRLCGRIGGGPIAPAEVFDPNVHQWYVACGGPNGGTHPNDNPTCNASFGFESVAPVATFPGCEGYFPGLFDLEGNVSEWVDGCEGNSGEGDVCYVMGGSTLDQTSYCTESSQGDADPWLRSTKIPYTGFRCCSG
jgi:formylglycine-generating enzyme required for sulfatase activity